MVKWRTCGFKLLRTGGRMRELRENNKLTSTCSLFTVFRSDTIEFLSSSSHKPSPNTSDPRIYGREKKLIIWGKAEANLWILTKNIKLKRHRTYFAQHDPTSWLILMIDFWIFINWKFVNYWPESDEWSFEQWLLFWNNPLILRLNHLQSCQHKR